MSEEKHYEFKVDAKELATTPFQRVFVEVGKTYACAIHQQGACLMTLSELREDGSCEIEVSKQFARLIPVNETEDKLILRLEPKQ